MSQRIVGIYPGTFDPITNGHLDIIQRGMRIVDDLIIAVAVNAAKSPMFGLECRVDMVQAEIADLAEGGKTIEVRPFDNLLVHFAQSVGASVVLRGLRAVSDFEYEFQMAGMNARLDENIETVFLMASEQTQFISSRFVREIGQLGGDISDFVPPRVESRLRDKFEELKG